MITQENKSILASNKTATSILLVDDNPTNLQVLMQTLSSKNYHLLVARNGESALRIAERTRPALVLLDIIMPGMDGYETCRLLKKNESTRDIAVIFLSALDHTKDKVKGLKTGAADYIAKPFQPEEVIARVEAHLKIHHLERVLSKRNRQLEADKARILASMNDGVLGLNIDSNIIFANNAAAQITGWSVLELQSKNFIDIKQGYSTNNCWGQNNESTIEVLPKISNKKTLEKSLFFNHKHQPFPVSYSCTPIMENDKKNGFVIVFKDITEETRQHEALQKALHALNEQKEKLTHVSRLSTMGEMAAGFAHEVNQPLTAICNYAQVARRMLDDLQISSHDLNNVIKKINQQARRAGDIISRIRSFVKKPDHIVSVVDPNQLISDTCKLAEVDANHYGIIIHMLLAKDLPLVKVDSVQIQQVALNLLRNAMEAMMDTPNKNQGVTIKTEMTAKRFVKVSVIDAGKGLAEGGEEKLFTPFYTTKPDGMGIGLSVCHSIIQSHSGRLRYHNRSSGGTIFDFTMPTVE